jgi:hypothetical protein
LNKLAPLRSAIGILEYWNIGVVGSKEEKPSSKMAFFRFYCPLFHYSIIPTFHVAGIKQDATKNPLISASCTISEMLN